MLARFPDEVKVACHEKQAWPADDGGPAFKAFHPAPNQPSLPHPRMRVVCVHTYHPPHHMQARQTAVVPFESDGEYTAETDMQLDSMSASPRTASRDPSRKSYARTRMQHARVHVCFVRLDRQCRSQASTSTTPRLASCLPRLSTLSDTK